LRELEEYYSYDDLLDILEINAVKQYNRYLATKTDNRKRF